MVNKLQLLGWVAIMVIIISVVNIGIKITGKATDTDTAVVNVTIESATVINFTTDFIDFGSGRVFENSSSAILDSNGSGSIPGGNWTEPGTVFTLENIGNTNVSIELATGKDADGFLGGTTPGYKYAYLDNEAGSCINQTGDQALWIDVNSTAPGTLICNPLYSADANDAIDIRIQITIPSDSLSGEQTDTFTATATAV